MVTPSLSFINQTAYLFIQTSNDWTDFLVRSRSKTGMNKNASIFTIDWPIFSLHQFCRLIIKIDIRAFKAYRSYSSISHDLQQSYLYQATTITAVGFDSISCHAQLIHTALDTLCQTTPDSLRSFVPCFQYITLYKHVSHKHYYTGNYVASYNDQQTTYGHNGYHEIIL